MAYAILTSVGISKLPSDPRFYWTLRILAAGVLLYLAISCFRSAWHVSARKELTADAPSKPGLFSGYLTGVNMTLINPMTLVFWITVVPGSATAISAPVDLPMNCLGVFIGTLAWVLFFATLLHRLGQFRRPGWLALLDTAGGIVLFAFAIATLLR